MIRREATPSTSFCATLLRSVSYRHEPLDTLVSRAVIGGTQGVMQVAITAPQNQPRRNHDQEEHDHQQ